MVKGNLGNSVVRSRLRDLIEAIFDVEVGKGGDKFAALATIDGLTDAICDGRIDIVSDSGSLKFVPSESDNEKASYELRAKRKAR